MKKGLITLSGGIDSVVLAYWLKKVKNYYLNALIFDYGQRCKKEIECAKVIANLLKIPFLVLDISNVFKHLSSFLIQKGTSVIVPNRNMIFLSIAVAFAESMGVNKVFFATHKDDELVFLDCRTKFIKKLSEASQLATCQKVSIETPFDNFTKSVIIKLGYNLGVPFEKTYSCYLGQAKHCGKCLACQERLKAFAKSKLKDPVAYENSS